MIRFSIAYLSSIFAIASLVFCLPVGASYQPPDNGGPKTTTGSGTRVIDEPPSPEHRGSGR